MKAGHLKRRAPRGHHGFAWGRLLVPDDHGGRVVYRLFLRDSTGRSYMNAQEFHVPTLERDHLAYALRGMRRQLRWAVDKVEWERLDAESQVAPCAGGVLDGGDRTTGGGIGYP